MEKEIKINVKFNSEFEIKSYPDLDNWNNASIESKNLYVKEEVKEYLLNQIDDIIDELLDDSNIEY